MTIGDILQVVVVMVTCVAIIITFWKSSGRWRFDFHVKGESDGNVDASDVNKQSRSPKGRKSKK